MLTQARVREVLSYDPTTGEFTRLVGRRAGRKCRCSLGRSLQVMIDGRNYANAHRLAFLYMNGAWPAGQVDHINGVRSDNRWANLRDVDQSTNMQNRQRSQSNSKTGVLGVSPSIGRYRAAIDVDGKFKHLGRFDSVEEAAAAYLAAKRQFHGGNTL